MAIDPSLALMYALATSSGVSDVVRMSRPISRQYSMDLRLQNHENPPDNLQRRRSATNEKSATSTNESSIHIPLAGSPVHDGYARNEQALRETKVLRSIPRFSPLVSTVSVPHKLQLSTLNQIFRYAVKRYPERRCLATRKVVTRTSDQQIRQRDVTNTEDRETVVNATERHGRVKVTGWMYLSFSEVEQQVNLMARALERLVPRHGPMHMFARTSANWFMMSHAAARLGITLVGTSSKLGPKTLTRILEETEATAIFVDSDLLDQLLTPLIECPGVKVIVYNPTTVFGDDLLKIEEDVAMLQRGLDPNMRILSVPKLLKMGGESRPCSRKLDESSDAYLDSAWAICYPGTLSPTTPLRGVIHTHRNIMAIIAGLHQSMRDSLLSTDTYLTHLFLYASLEYGLVTVFFLSGLAVGFATNVEKYLLSSPYSDLHPSCEGDIKSFEPTFIYAIMPWWTKVHQLLLDMVRQLAPTDQKRFWKWLERKKYLREKHLDFASVMLDLDQEAGFASIRERFFGKRVRWLGNHCFMMPKEKRDILGMVLAGPNGHMMDGWCCVEINSAITFMAPNTLRSDSIGSILPSVEIKLVEASGTGTFFDIYANTYKGIIHIRGPSVPTGFFYPNSKTVDSADTSSNAVKFHPDGWVETDKIGEWDAKKKQLRITDKLNPLSDRYLGDYICVEVLEKVYKLSPIVEDCCVLFLWSRARPAAVVKIVEADLRNLCRGKMDTSDLDTLLLNPSAKMKILHLLQKHAEKHSLVGCERIGSIVFSKDGFSKGNRLLTPEGLLDRKAIRKRFIDEIENEWLGD